MSYEDQILLNKMRKAEQAVVLRKKQSVENMIESAKNITLEDEAPPVKNDNLSTTIYMDDQAQLSFMKKPLKSLWAESDTKG